MVATCPLGNTDRFQANARCGGSFLFGEAFPGFCFFSFNVFFLVFLFASWVFPCFDRSMLLVYSKKSKALLGITLPGFANFWRFYSEFMFRFS